MAGTDTLRRGLRDAGFSKQAIDAAWPSWWSEELADDPSGRTELRFTLARRLGVSPKELLGERVRFVWNDEARFKHLSVQDAAHRAALASFGMTVGRALIRATEPGDTLEGVSASELRLALLSDRPVVDLPSLLYACWAVGVPVIHLKVFPLQAKSMHAMVVAVDGRYAVLLARDALYPAPVAFTLAHEIGHIALSHLDGVPALVDLEDPATSANNDDQEDAADRYGLELLTGSASPQIETSGGRMNAPGLATAVLREAGQQRIDPGTLALCVAHQTGAWAIAQSALKFIYSDPQPVSTQLNTLAASQLDWDRIGHSSADWLKIVMGLRD